MTKDTIIALFVLIILVMAVIIFGKNMGQPDQGEVIPVEEMPGKAEEIEVNIFFVDLDLMSEGTVDYVDMIKPVKRTVLSDAWNPEKALELLFDGLNEEENAWLTTSLPAGASWNDLVIEEGSAYLDLSEEFERIAGSATVITLREQISQTLLQFPEIDHLMISVRGASPEESLQP